MNSEVVADELSAVRWELGRVDTKVNTLLAVAAVAAGFLTSQIGKPLPVAAALLLATAAVSFVAAVVVALTGILWPRRGPSGFWLFSRLSAGQIETTLRGTNPVRLAAEDLHVLSQVTVRKQVGIRRMIVLIVGGFVLIGIAQIVGVFA